MSKHKVEITGIKTSELKVLTNDEQMKLFNKMKNGDKLAREQMKKKNLDLDYRKLHNSVIFFLFME